MKITNNTRGGVIPLLGGMFAVLFSITLLGAGCAPAQAPSSSSGLSDGSDSGESGGVEIGGNPDDTAAPTDPPQADTSDTSPAAPEIPEGWVEYESEIYENLSFAYPPDWHVMEDTRLGILVSDTAFPDPLPPDVYAPVVIDERTQDMSEALETLREIDSEGRSENIEVNGHIGVKYTYETLSGPRVVYLLERSSDRLIGYGIDRTSDIGDAESILNTLVF